MNYCNGTKTASHSSGYFMNRLFPVLEPGTTSCSLRINLNSTQHLTLKTLVRDVHILNFQHHDCVRYLKLTLTKNSNKQEIVFYEDINANYNADQIEITFYNDCLGSSPTARYRYLIYYKGEYCFKYVSFVGIYICFSVSNGVPLNLTEWTDATLNPIEPGTGMDARHSTFYRSINFLFISTLSSSSFCLTPRGSRISIFFLVGNSRHPGTQFSHHCTHFLHRGQGQKISFQSRTQLHSAQHAEKQRCFRRSASQNNTRGTMGVTYWP